MTGIARLVIDAGADGITVHPRPDERHIRPADVRALAELVTWEYANRVEFNVEGYPDRSLLDLVHELKPTQVTLVPDAPDQRTSDHGWDLETSGEDLVPIIAELRVAGMRVSLFVDPDAATMPLAAATGADRIELYTEPYAHAYASGNFRLTLDRYASAADAALAAGLEINAGHDLTRANLPAFKQRIPELAEVSIGHAITADALTIGFPEAVHAYLAAVA